MTSSFRKDLWFSLKIALLSTLIALGIDGLIRILRYLPVLFSWLISCA